MTSKTEAALSPKLHHINTNYENKMSGTSNFSSCNLPGANTNSLDLAQSVEDVMAMHPGALAVLAAYGLDSCCGRKKSLFDAACDADVEPEVIAEALRQTMQSNEPVTFPIAGGL